MSWEISAGHMDMIKLTPFPKIACVPYWIKHDVAIHNTKGSLKRSVHAHGKKFGWCNFAGCPCNPPPPAQMCLLNEKHHMPWQKDQQVHLLLRCNNPPIRWLTLTQPWTHQQISHGAVLMVPVLVPACPQSAATTTIRSQSGISSLTSWAMSNSY